MNGWPSSKVFAPSREKRNCPDDCETCKLTLKTNCCFTKHVVYQIMCSNCNITYIGETGRTVGSRIKEHLRMKKQTVFVHLKSHSDNPFKECPISWKILHSNIKSHSERKIIEALEIQKHSDNIMNGCIQGRRSWGGWGGGHVPPNFWIGGDEYLIVPPIFSYV